LTPAQSGASLLWEHGHALVVGAFVDLHPGMPHDVPAPGVFYRHYGRRDVTTFITGHLGFDFLVGVGYAVLHADLQPSAAF
jgi:hypothetical protein